MAGLFPYSLYSQPKDDINFNGGLNSTNGPLSLKDTESSDLQNINMNKFGSILKRSGYLNIVSEPNIGKGQLLTDGGFEIWTNSTTLTNWTLEGTSASLARTTNPVYSGTYSAGVTRSGTNCNIFQNITPTLIGTSYTFTCYAYATVANAVLIQAYDGTILSSSTTHPGDSTWHPLTVTFTATSTSAVQVFCSVNGTNTTGYFDSAILYVSNLSLPSDGLMWFEYTSAGSYASNLMEAINGKIYSMSNLNGKWTDITGAATVTAGNFFQSTNWLNTIYMTNGKDSPLQWNGSSNVTTLPALQANSYTFTVFSITTNPTVGATYTNNGITYTVAFVNTSGSAGSIAGTIIATGSGAPTTFGILTKASGTGDATINFSLEVLNADITSAKYITQWNNFLFLANVNINNGTFLPTRIYWCQVNDPTTWSAINWIEISTLDGQPITGMYPLADRLVIFKERSIYNLFFTGDSTLPFVYLVSNSPTVGCMAPYSIQEVENGLVFLSYDGFYYYDSNNSYKMSLQIQNTISSLNLSKLSNAKSLKQRNKNLYMCAVTSSDSTNNDTVITWDWVLNAFSLYSGMSPSAMRTVFVNGNQEEIYFADYYGYTYEMDTGVDDYPLGIQTAISAYYWTNWKSFGDAMLQKVDPNVVIYYESSNAVLTFGYSYDFDQGIDYQNTFSLAQGTSVWGSAIWDTSTWSGSGGLLQRQDLDGRGRVMRFYFANSNMSETFQIDGLASFVNAETNAG